MSKCNCTSLPLRKRSWQQDAVRNVSTFESQRSAACRGWDDSSVTFPPALGELNIMRESRMHKSVQDQHHQHHYGVVTIFAFATGPHFKVSLQSPMFKFAFLHTCYITILHLFCVGRPHMWLSEGHPQHPLSGTGALRVSCRDPPV